MPKLKAEFQKTKLTLCNTNYVPLGVLTNKTHLSAHNIMLSQAVNDTATLSFDIAVGGLINTDSTELLIKHKNEYYVIKEIEMSNSEQAVAKVRAEHIACELKGIMVGYFEELIGETPSNMWNTVVTNSTMAEVINSKYVFETNIIDTFRYLSSEDEKSVFEYLITIAQQFDACILFSTDTYGVIHINLLYGDIDRGRFVRKGKDLKQLDLTFNTEALFTKITPFGATDDDGVEVTIMDVNDGKSYLTNYNYYLSKGMTMDEISSNPLCNQECVYRNEDIDDPIELLRLATDELEKISQPVVDGNISTIDLNAFEGSLYLTPILCEKIIAIDKDTNYAISCRVTSVDYNYENPLETQIGISNVIRYNSTLKDLVHQGNILDKVITNDKNGKPNINASKVHGIIDGHIAQLKYSMEDSITDITDAVVLFENRIEGDKMFGALAIGARGILISTKIDPATNQWVWTTAIDAKGLSTQIVNAIEINGSQIRGDKISSYDEKTWINLDDGTFNFANRMFYDGQKFTIHLGDGTDLDEWKQQYEDDKALMDTELQDIKDSLGNLDDIIGDTFSDGIITEVERIRIEDSLIDLEKEKEDINNRYTLAINDVGLTGGEEDDLKSAYTSFNTKYTQLVQVINDVILDDKATELEKTNYQSKLREYNETIPPLTVAFDNALKKIAENKTKTLINETKSDIERDIQNIQQSVDDLEGTMLNSFRDGIIDETEYKTIKESVHRLNTEKLDIDRNYEHLSANIYIQSKTELLEEFEDTYDNYVENHETLTSYVDETIGDRVATEEEITNINDMFNSYDEALAEYSVMQTKVMGEIADATASSNLDEYKEIVNKDIIDVNTRINNLILDVGGAISDNILDQAELRIIENSITALETEKVDVDKRYTEIMEDTVNFKGDARSVLSSSYSNFNTAHTNLINSINDMTDENYATELEKQVYRDAVNSYNTALSTLSSAFDKALNEIAKNSAQAIMEAIRQEIQSDISDVQDNIDELEDYMGNAFRDGILSDAEKESIRTHLLTLATEKKDVEQQYTSLIGMADLVGTAKTNLQDAYGNESKGYVQAYNSLINTINQILNKETVNESDRTSLTNSFNNHDAKLANYSLRVNEAIESISEKKKQDLNNDITAKIEVLQNAISLRVTETRMEEIITERVEGIEVGGRNLIRNSAFMSGKTNWTFQTNVEIDSTQTFNGHPTVVSRQSGLTSFQWGGVSNKYLPNDPTSFKRGETLTVSCWYKAIKSTFDATLALEVKGFRGNSTTSQTILMRVSVPIDGLKEDWTQISQTKTLDADWNGCYVSAWVEKNGTAWFTDFKLEKGNKATDWTPSIEDTQLQFNALQDMADSLQNQVDGKIQTYYQNTDPSTNWTSTEKTAHEGDIWHDTLNNFTYRWNGSAWNKLTDADAEEAKTLANSKAQIFVYTPTTPYYVGDLWVQGGNYDGEIMRCNNTRTSGKYTANDWSKAAKYTDDTVANNVANNLVNSYYTKTQTDSAINVSKEGILSTVSTTYTTKDNMNNTLTNYVTKSEASLNKDSILSTVSSTYTTKNEMNNTLANYTKKSELSQTADSITATFTSSGGGNLVRNGELKNGIKFWWEHEYSLTGSDLNRGWQVRNDEWTGYEPSINLTIANMSSGEYGVCQTIETVVGRQYVLTCYLAGHRGNYCVVVRGTTSSVSNWLTHKYYGETHGGSNPNDWHRVVIPFVAQRTDTIIEFNITSSIENVTNNTYLWVKRVMVCEGTVWTPFVPHSSEIYEGITKIDQDGIEVSHSQVSTKSQMTASGFFINDSNGDVIAELSSANQWSILRADEIYAQNIRRVYMGDANLYVDHSKGTCGTGTSSSPFNSFSALTSHFEDKGMILNKDVTVYVVSTGNVSDNLDIRGLSGRGTLTIRLDKGLILNSNSVAECAIYFYDCNTIITVDGGRSAYDSTDGALLNKWGCGVRFTKCKYGRVEKIAIDSTKNNKMGVMFDATDGIADKVDTCNSYYGLWATRGSQVYQYDCCGSASTSFYSGEGALIQIGGESNGIKINGSYRRATGNILDFGTNPAGRTSYRTAPAVPSTSDRWQSFTYSDYGYYSVGQACWNPNGKKVYQGDWG